MLQQNSDLDSFVPSSVAVETETATEPKGKDAYGCNKELYDSAVDDYANDMKKEWEELKSLRQDTIAYCKDIIGLNNTEKTKAVKEVFGILYVTNINKMEKDNINIKKKILEDKIAAIDVAVALEEALVAQNSGSSGRDGSGTGRPGGSSGRDGSGTGRPGGSTGRGGSGAGSSSGITQRGGGSGTERPNSSTDQSDGSDTGRSGRSTGRGGSSI